MKIFDPDSECVQVAVLEHLPDWPPLIGGDWRPFDELQQLPSRANILGPARAEHMSLGQPCNEIWLTVSGSPG